MDHKGKSHIDPKWSARMAKIGSKNTSPEIVIRKLIHRMGFRYRLHYKRLPGSPDLAFPKYKAVIQVNGCFWHGHNCHIFKWPKTRKEFWREKIKNNQQRDKKNTEAVKNLGWKTLTVWECAVLGKTKLNEEDLMVKLTKWLEEGVADWEIAGEN